MVKAWKPQEAEGVTPRKWGTPSPPRTRGGKWGRRPGSGRYEWAALASALQGVAVGGDDAQQVKVAGAGKRRSRFVGGARECQVRLDWRPRSATPALQDAWSWGGPLLANIPEAPRAPGHGLLPGAPEPLPRLEQDAISGQGSGGGGPAAAPITAQARDWAWTNGEKFLLIPKARRGGEPGPQPCREAGSQSRPRARAPRGPTRTPRTPPTARPWLPRGSWWPAPPSSRSGGCTGGCGGSGPLTVVEPLRLPGAQPALGDRGAARVTSWQTELTCCGTRPWARPGIFSVIIW
nr:TLC domain-containing protein 2 isoform X1 [Pan troglodytes]